MITRNTPLRMSPEGMNKTIAINIFPTQKGWAWKRGQPIDFAQPGERINLQVWASRQAWWNLPAPGIWYQKGMDPTIPAKQIYNQMCIDFGGGHINERQLAFHFRNLIAECIEQWVKNGNGSNNPAHSIPS